jgi:hypothetical protein
MRCAGSEKVPPTDDAPTPVRAMVPLPRMFALTVWFWVHVFAVPSR